MQFAVHGVVPPISNESPPPGRPVSRRQGDLTAAGDCRSDLSGVTRRVFLCWSLEATGMWPGSWEPNFGH